MPRHLVLQASLIVCLAAALPASCRGQDTALPEAPSSLASAPAATKSVHTRTVAIVNGRPYQPPTGRQQFRDYLKDSYGLPAMASSVVRSLFAQASQTPSGWGQDWPGYGQRFGSAVAVTAINGNVRYGLETIFHEDMRYIPCHGCSVRRKIGNALLAEITARHDKDGHRFFTVTPIVADFSGPLVAHSFWFPPGHGPVDGLVATRTVLATRVGGHLIREFILERRHKDPKLEDGPPPQN